MGQSLWTAPISLLEFFFEHQIYLMLEHLSVGLQKAKLLFFGSYIRRGVFPNCLCSLYKARQRNRSPSADGNDHGDLL